MNSRVATAGILAVLLLILVLAALIVRGGSSRGSVLDLIPDDTYYVKIWDVEGVLGRDFPSDEADRFEDYLDRTFTYLDFLLDDVEAIVYVEGRGGTLWILEGNHDLEQVRYELEDLDYKDDEYRGYEVWQEEEGRESLALLEEGRYVIIGVGEDDPVIDVLRSLRRDRGFVLDEEDNALGRVLAKAGKGWIVTVSDGCDISSDLQRCESTAIVVDKANDPNSINVYFTFLFQHERSAKAGARDLDDIFERNNWTRNMNIEDAEEDGPFVTIYTTMDKDFLRDLNILKP